VGPITSGVQAAVCVTTGQLIYDRIQRREAAAWAAQGSPRPLDLPRLHRRLTRPRPTPPVRNSRRWLARGTADRRRPDRRRVRDAKARIAGT